VARVSRRGTAAVLQTRGHWRRLAGRRGSERWWGPRGGETECGRWPEIVAVGESLSVEMMHDVGWLRGPFTAAA
jgi:hypothetical protein